MAALALLVGMFITKKLLNDDKNELNDDNNELNYDVHKNLTKDEAIKHTEAFYRTINAVNDENGKKNDGVTCEVAANLVGNLFLKDKGLLWGTLGRDLQTFKKGDEKILPYIKDYFGWFGGFLGLSVPGYLSPFPEDQNKRVLLYERDSKGARRKSNPYIRATKVSEKVWITNALAWFNYTGCNSVPVGPNTLARMTFIVTKNKLGEPKFAQLHSSAIPGARLSDDGNAFGPGSRCFGVNSFPPIDNGEDSSDFCLFCGDPSKTMKDVETCDDSDVTPCLNCE